MRFLLDADALIKLNRIGVLAVLAAEYDCAAPSNVYQEVVTDAKARGYADADELAQLLGGVIEVVSGTADGGVFGLGDGESAILTLLAEWPDALPVSDDRKFQGVLVSQSIAFLSTSDVVSNLGQHGVLTLGDAIQALGALRPLINEMSYQRALQDLMEVNERDNSKQK